MDLKFLKYEKHGEMAQVWIHRPEAMNALNLELLKEIFSLWEHMENDHISVALLSGEGKAFVAGADIAAMSEYDETKALEFTKIGHRTMDKIQNSDIISIALVNGFTLGGGLELALACDIRVGTEHSKLGFPEVNLGLIPGFGGTQRLSRLVGMGKAKELIFTGERINHDEAHKLGILNKIVSPESLWDEGKKMAHTILEKGPIAVRQAKMILNTTDHLSIEEGNKKEMKIFASLFGKPESKEGLSAFLEKRKSNFPK
jgi:enoyl-CoA hydratase